MDESIPTIGKRFLVIILKILNLIEIDIEAYFYKHLI